MRILFGRLEKATRYAAVGAICVMMCLVTADAAGRYLLNKGIFGAYEITEQYLMILAVFLGISDVYRGGALIRVTFLVDRLPARVRMALEYFNHFFCIALVLLFFAASLKKAYRMYVTGAAMDFGSLPLWPAYLVVSLGLLFLAIAMMIDIPKLSEGRSGHVQANNQI